ncbi:MAG: hypothetical protein ACI395_05270 [Candidatus Cryptobacteroides sp.]
MKIPKAYLIVAASLTFLAGCSKEEMPPAQESAADVTEGKAEVTVEIPSNLIAEETVVLERMSLLDTVIVFNPPVALTENIFVRFGTAPFTVPEGGIEVVFRTEGGREFSSTALSGPDDAGIKVEDGEKFSFYVPSADPFIPCTFPVVYPLGKNPDARTGYYNYSDDQPDWRNLGIWRCFAQKQSWAKWVKVSDPSSRFTQIREMANTGEIGSIGLKGIWTGDYFEFTFPVEGIKAGSTVSFNAPFYGRQQPVFWTVEWLDGGVWTRDTAPVTTWENSVTLEASFATRLYGVVIDYSFTLKNPIERGELKVRLICTDGRYQADTATGTVVERSLPYNNGTAYYSPFYFYCEGSGVNAFTWDIK